MKKPALGQAKPLRVVGLLLLALLGFALAASVHAQRTVSSLAAARPDDLVRILDDLDSRSARLRTQISGLEHTREQLAGSGSAAVALAEARKRTQDLGILAGTIAAQGPGIEITITDPRHSVAADVFVDVIEELRDSGAETLELAGMRLGATSWVADASGGAGGLSVDGHAVTSPYLIRAIGDPATMEKALEIPGGIVDTVRARSGASIRIQRAATVRVTSLRALPSAGYVRPTHS